MENKEKESTNGKPLIDRIVDFIFSKDIKKHLIWIVLLGLILRIILASNIAPLGDEMVHGPHAINIISSGVLNTQNEATAWFYLTDISYSLFGINFLSARLLSVFFGTLTILIVFLIAKELFNEKIGVIAAFLLSISAYHIRYALVEMDQAMMFLVLLSFYFFYKGLKYKKQISYLSIILISVAMLVKPIAIPFMPAYVIYFFYFLYKQPISERKAILNRNIKRGIVGIIIFFLAASPVLAYNYILYEQKGLVDVIFSRFFKISNEFFSPLQGYSDTFELSKAFPTGFLVTVRDSFFSLDPLIFIIGVLGIGLLFVRKKHWKSGGRFFVLFHLTTYIFLIGTTTLQTHTSSFMPLFCLTGAVFLSDFSKLFSNEKNRKRLIYIILIIILIFNLFALMPHLSSRSAIPKMRSYVSDNINEKDIVIADSRIYRGRIAFMFNDRAYIEASTSNQLLAINQELPGITNVVNLYFIECAPDDCGWGTIKDQPEFNQSMEDIVEFFKNNTVLEKTIYGGGGYDERTGKPYFKIYKTQFEAKSQLYDIIYDTHDWFYYPLRWEKNDWYDKYSPRGFFQVSLNSIGEISLWLSLLFILITPYFLIRELFKNSKS